jgi:hypothetical protein
MKNGFVVYPNNVPKYRLRDARKEAIEQSKQAATGFESRIERVWSAHVVERYRAGRMMPLTSQEAK